MLNSIDYSTEEKTKKNFLKFKKIPKSLYYWNHNKQCHIRGVHSGLEMPQQKKININGDCSRIFGVYDDLLRGDVSLLSGDISYITGLATGVSGDCTDIHADLDMIDREGYNHKTDIYLSDFL